MKLGAIILAAGKSTRMKTAIPKVLHRLAGKPMIEYALEAVEPLSSLPPVVVVGYQGEEVQKAVGERAQFAHQEPQLGTAHAVLQAQPLLEGKVDTVVITYADMPLITQQTLLNLWEVQKTNPGPLSLLTLESETSRGFGRILRDPNGKIQAIIEEAVATPDQLAIQELNVGIYCVQAEWLWKALPRISLSPKGEYFLTDLVELAVKDGLEVKTVTLSDPTEAIGINHRGHLAEAEAILHQRINTHWMLAGVTIIDPQSTYIEADVLLGQDTVIYPNTYLQGKTVIGEACMIGPNTVIRDSQIGSRCEVFFSVVEKATLEDDVDVGPYAHLRKGAHLAKGVHMGNFGEVKNSYLGPGTKMGHFSYIGDATIGAEVNIGAGTITCNYDGEKKNPTEIGEGAFIGSDTMLVAPVKVGKGARTGAGAVVTRDVPPHSLAVGVPARVIRKLKDEDG
ncbi:MAG: bifunctional UDP-N-acetylglucosamine diphosphorylase/glucosamine-1-phosphate N-acetyltransferase GlmU [Anaerolineales bacterium]|nr:bifunctional UDP-N-acetylglucosamine diphosphorylase/glucosamine-1-phosphate N-acetyltransferase GlmU [Anaerolineales bacterium]